MRYTIRKQTQQDFHTRVRRVDPNFVKHGVAAARPSPRKTSPGLSALLGFGWIYLVVSIARNSDYLRGSLAQGSLSSEEQTWIMGALAALLAVSAVMIALHVLRVVVRRKGERGNSGSLLAGAAAAALLCYAPPSVLQTGLGLLDANSAGLLQTASLTVKDSVGIDLGSVTLVSGTR